ncbi:MAG: DNA repair protein RadA, partial [Nitrospirae bacterium]
MKIKSSFKCSECGYTSLKWLGRCPQCGNWNSFSEQKEEKKSFLGNWASPQRLSDVAPIGLKRYSTGIGELDRVLGGGIVPGSIVLIAGDPGIGKSTLVLHAMEGLSKPGTILYVSGEESPQQIKLRAERIGIKSDRIILLTETMLEGILSRADEIKPEMIVVDSIQTVFSGDVISTPGSVTQVRECATRLMFYAKKRAVPIFITGHVTKQGDIAGPRVLEHIVDTVLYFEGGKTTPFRILRAVKNRFGSTNEIGIFMMRDRGLIEVENPSEIFLTQRNTSMPGSVVVATMEGTRPLLIEIQALVSPANFSIPRRTSLGVDANRVSLLIAILDKRLGINIGGMDIFVNVVGGLKIDEPAVDLAVVSALISSFRNKSINPDTFVFGEIGLSGELRRVNNADVRLKEAERLGFKRGVVP